MARILHVLLSVDPAYGGPVSAALGLIGGQIKSGYQVTTVALGEQRPATWPGELMLIRPSRLGFLPAQTNLISLRMILRAARTARSAHATHIHFSRAPQIVLLVLLLRVTSRCYLIQTHGMSTPWKKIFHRLYDSIFTASCLRGATFVVCLSNREVNELKVRYRRIAPIIRDNAVSLMTTLVQRTQPPTPHFLFCSRLHPRKGLDVFLQAVALLCEQGWKFTVLGADEGSLKSGQEFALRNNLEVAFRGSVDPQQVRELMLEATALVHPAEDEPFGMSMVESLWLGTPVVTAKSAALSARLEANAGAILVDRENISGYTDAMRVLGRMRTQDWQALSTRSTLWARSAFGPESVSSTFDPLYPQIRGS